MSDHVVLELIKQADKAITNEDFEALMAFYADDAVLVVQPGQIARGKTQIRQAFEAIAKHFKNALTVTQGEAHAIEGAGTVLVVMETLVFVRGAQSPIKRRATYVFKGDCDNGWLCSVDNSYGTELLDAT
ncbi:YybH family protein [Primorskyibacter sp. S187A]|uniref:YybH family protein n=1 Tax=Primorskyibacter sp. S187A TaxID=3415130 RepID=UPI003C7C870D